MVAMVVVDDCGSLHAITPISATEARQTGANVKNRAARHDRSAPPTANIDFAEVFKIIRSTDGAVRPGQPLRATGGPFGDRPRRGKSDGRGAFAGPLAPSRLATLAPTRGSIRRFIACQVEMNRRSRPSRTKQVRTSVA